MGTEAWLIEGGERVPLKLSDDAGGAATAETSCSCGSPYVLGSGMQTEGFDGYRAYGFCAKCREPRGTIHARVQTLFGVEEDERVLGGPWRVY
jgi:hypothetical protein